MTTKTYTYEPDYGVRPGWVLEERLEAREMSHAEFARRCGRSPKLISEIISGRAPIEPRTALQFEMVLGVDAGIWLGIESDYRLHLEREAQKTESVEQSAWAKSFPINELVKRGYILQRPAGSERLSSVLSFFGVASVEAWNNKWRRVAVAYRHSPSFKSDEHALATWLRMGEFEADQVPCEPYDEPTFRRSLTQLRGLTANPSAETLETVTRLCANAGVLLTVIRPLSKTALSGAARWLTPRKALIQLTARHLSDDHLWFSLFHEAAHILLHSKKEIFVHGPKSSVITDEDAEADTWASDFLIPRRAWEQFVSLSEFTESDVIHFADEQRIAPGIVVGRLQHEDRLRWDMLNHLKVRFEWGTD